MTDQDVVRAAVADASVRPSEDRVADPALLARAADGDLDAFERLLQPRLPRLYRMAVAITRSEADARDAVQEASVSAWREVPRLRQPERFDAWLDQILVNACRMLLRRSRRVAVREVELGTEAEAEAAKLPDLGETDAIRRAFDRLDPGTRALLVLHDVEGRPIAEIARTLGQPTGTVKWRLSKARMTLGRALEVERR